MSWYRKWETTPVFLPGKSHGRRGLEGYSSWGHTELDVTDHTRTTISEICLGLNFSSRFRKACEVLIKKCSGIIGPEMSMGAPTPGPNLSPSHV